MCFVLVLYMFGLFCDTFMTFDVIQEFWQDMDLKLLRYKFTASACLLCSRYRGGPVVASILGAHPTV